MMVAWQAHGSMTSLITLTPQEMCSLFPDAQDRNNKDTITACQINLYLQKYRISDAESYYCLNRSLLDFLDQ
jgi:hypothetical protein